MPKRSHLLSTPTSKWTKYVKVTKIHEFSTHVHTHTLKETVHTFTLNTLINLTELRGTQVKSALKIPTFTKSIKPVDPVLSMSPWPPGLPCEFQYARVHGNL